MTKSDHKWWTDGVPENGRGHDMRFLFERRDSKKIATWAPEQIQSAIRNLEEMKIYFDSHFKETMKILKAKL